MQKTAKAIIYCRVSSQRQVTEGNGLSSQEMHCRNYAQQKGYSVQEVFHDEGISGGLFERPAMQALIAFLDKYPTERYIVIFDELSRFARDLKVHLQLKSELVGRGAILESPNFHFEQNEEGELIENVSASVVQYERQRNRRRVIQDMRARLEDGFWPFCPPLGLVNKKHLVYKKVLMPNEPHASICKEAIERYRDGLLNTLDEVGLFIRRAYKEYGIVRTISLSGVKNILTEILYTGWLQYEPWDVPLMKGKHDGFISIDTYNAVQERLSSKAKVPLRREYCLDFPLRGFVVCTDCGRAMTASWNKGRSARYPNYFCKNKPCKNCWKTIPKSRIEADFETLVAQFTPDPDVMALAKAVFEDIWNQRVRQEDKDSEGLARQIEELEDMKSAYVRRIPTARSETLVEEYEAQIEKITAEIRKIRGSKPEKQYTPDEFGTACETVLSVIKEPVRTWRSENYSDKRLLLEMYFDAKLSYSLENGFGTVPLACLSKLLTTKVDSENELVEMPGVEPGCTKSFRMDVVAKFTQRTR